MPRRILVPIAGPSSLVAVDRALEIATAEGALVTILVLEGRAPAGVVPVSAPDAPTVRRRTMLATAAREARSRGDALGEDLELVSRTGPPIEAIVGEARRCRADLLIVEEAMPWLPRWARRGGARRLGRDARCAVTVARPERIGGLTLARPA